MLGEHCNLACLKTNEVKKRKSAAVESFLTATINLYHPDCVFPHLNGSALQYLWFQPCLNPFSLPKKKAMNVFHFI